MPQILKPLVSQNGYGPASKPPGFFGKECGLVSEPAGVFREGVWAGVRASRFLPGKGVSRC